MKREIIATGKTVEEAIQNGIKQYGLDEDNVIKEVLERPKKGILGIGVVPAKVKIIYSETPAEIALNFVKTIVKEMDLNVEIEMDDKETDGGRVIRIKGEQAGALIGHHGDTLDAFQYLVNLAANKKEEGLSRNYTKIYLDIENYRDKREETLKALARRMAAKVLKNRRSITLEPMNPYERRIIHSEIQEIEGVTTISVGVDNNRRVVISLEEKGETKGKNRRNRRKKSRSADAGENSAANGKTESEEFDESIKYDEIIDVTDELSFDEIDVKNDGIDETFTEDEE